MPTPGLVTRSTPDGDDEILNGSSMVGNTQLRYGAWKWGKLSYRTGAHFTYAYPEISDVSPDSALTQQLDDGRRFGRHSTVTVELDTHHLGYTWNLGFKTGQVNTHVETFLFWRAGWLLSVHRLDPQQPTVFRFGGFALPLREPNVRRAETPLLAAWSDDTRGTALQPLLGFAAIEWDARLDDTTERRHVAAPYHITPVLRTGRAAARTPFALAALSWFGRDPAEAAPWRIDSGPAGAWRLFHPQLGPWHIDHWSLPALPSASA